MATVTVNTLEFVSALRALIPISKQATLYSGEKERNAATIAARITPAKKLALITGNSALGAVASVCIEQAVEAGEREFCLYTDDAKNITSIFKPNKQNSEEPLRLEFGDQLDSAAKEAIEHARRNLITDEDPKNITSYTGFAQ